MVSAKQFKNWNSINKIKKLPSEIEWRNNLKGVKKTTVSLIIFILRFAMVIFHTKLICQMKKENTSEQLNTPHLATRQNE